ncbi:Uncharacterised protein [uncultured archaeon]|nr:Uncharacterised protein [uncultured archaeon]
MKWKGHFLCGSIILLIACIALDGYLHIDSFLRGQNGSVIFILFFFPYIIGLLLPDADSQDAGSKIFFTVFFPIAYLARFLEHPISRHTKRPIGHRESLHTIYGIIITSFAIPLVLSIILLILLLLFGVKLSIDIPNLILFVQLFFTSFIGLLFGQLVHVICDFHFKLK